MLNLCFQVSGESDWEEDMEVLGIHTMLLDIFIISEVDEVDEVGVVK